MKTRFQRLTVAGLLAVCIASGAGCYPVYPPGGYYGASNGDSKDFVPQESARPQGPPVRYGVDPGLVIAGVAAAGLLGYAIGDHHNYHNSYCGSGYYRTAPYYGRGYYAPRYYR